jgi:hypothetical protein
MGRAQMRALLHTHEQTQARADSEYGGLRDVERVFGLRETMTYELFNQGAIRGVLVRTDKRSPRGKRLFCFQSIRKYLAGLESTGDTAPKSDGARKAVAARMERAVARDTYKRGESTPHEAAQ